MMKLLKRLLPLVVPALCSSVFAAGEPSIQEQTVFSLEMGFDRITLTRACSGCNHSASDALIVDPVAPTLRNFYSDPMLFSTNAAGSASLLKSLLTQNNEAAQQWLVDSRSQAASGKPVGLYIASVDGEVGRSTAMDNMLIAELRQSLLNHPDLGQEYIQSLESSGCFQKPT